ncbi:UNVERIFIED_CONTAM: hypothetical protein Sangu_2139500 [Sesamum angustifolium]|uniref:Uncharacterized protein n=1 Tax=Sesamum angustifolium TaxID=2727405 RepID=A0AAW2LCZ1_9LAMI
MVVSGDIRYERKMRLASKLEVRLMQAHDRYLRLPAMAGESKRVLFHSIRDCFWDHIAGWNNNLLSQAGKGMLIKSVLPSLPIYAMQCFELPNHLLRDLEKAMRDFLWHNKGDRRVHWEAWRKMCRLFAKGDMGFRDLKAFC